MKAPQKPSLPIEGVWAVENAAGRAYGVGLIRAMQKDRNPTLLSRKAAALAGRTLSGFEVGLFSIIAQQAGGCWRCVAPDPEPETPETPLAELDETPA